MKKICMPIFLSLTLSGCAGSHLDMSNISNIHSAKIHDTPSESIIVISDEQLGQLWYRLGQSRKLENLSLFTGTTLQSVDQISISPDDHWLAVITVGEGHPLLDVYDLQAVLGEYENMEERESFSPLSLDPYPGYVQILGWQGDQLILSSDVHLDHLDKRERRVTEVNYDSVDATFLWHIPTDSITNNKGQK